MPLTPRFDLSQSDTEVIVRISVPTVRITNVEVLLEETTLHFHASPYLLKLDFSPHEFSQDVQGVVSAEYNPTEQTVTIPLAKAKAGVDWPHLDLTARLMQPREIPRSQQWLQTVESNPNHAYDEADADSTDSEPKQTPMEHSSGYGFGNIFFNIFTDYCRSGMAQEMLQLSDPDNTSVSERTHQRIEKEKNDFDSERYLQDLYIEEDYLYPMVMQFQPFWQSKLLTTSDLTTDSNHKEKKGEDVDLASQLGKQLNLDDSSSTNDTSSFTSDEKLQLSTIPYPLIPTSVLDVSESSHLWFGLVDLLLPFVYDHWTTMGDSTVESAWTITILSSSLSWLDPPTTLTGAIQVSCRRMLMYPYWRNWDFLCLVWKQTLSLLKCGIRTVIKSLLMTRNILEKSESYYVGNKLFVDPYLYWIQQINSNTVPACLVKGVEDALNSPNKLKETLGLGLESMERELREEISDDEAESDDNSATSDDSDTDRSSEDQQEAILDVNTPTPIEVQVSADRKAVAVAHENLLDSAVGCGSSILEIVDKDDDQNANKPQTLGKGAMVEKKSRPLIQEL